MNEGTTGIVVLPTAVSNGDTWKGWAVVSKWATDLEFARLFLSEYSAIGECNQRTERVIQVQIKISAL